jgi:DNA-binding response OmpR family regulator
MARKVLLIEDEPNITEAMRFIFGRDGWLVSAEPDGAKAFSAISYHRPDLVILDVMLPGVSGFEVLNILRADPVFGQTPVIMLTAKGLERDRDASLRAGANLFIAKPFANADLLKAARDLVEK